MAPLPGLALTISIDDLVFGLLFYEKALEVSNGVV
jgi:hypothetical protein